MRKQLNMKEVSEIVNKFRIEHKDQKFVRPQIIEALKNLGIGGNIAQILITKLPSEIVAGKSKLYSMPETPIHYRDIEDCYKKRREYSKPQVAKTKKKQTSDKPVLEIALEVVQEAGYMVSRPVFDLDRFVKENPELYRRYIRYERID